MGEFSAEDLFGGVVNRKFHSFSKLGVLFLTFLVGDELVEF